MLFHYLFIYLFKSLIVLFSSMFQDTVNCSDDDVQ